MEEQTNGKQSSEQQLRRLKSTKRYYAFTALIAFVVLVAVISVLTATHQTKSNRVAQVHITAKGFEPATITVERGTKVTWTNDDSALHQVMANPYPAGKDLSSLRSEILNNTQTYTYVADKAGNFGYHDQMHPTVNGTIVIRK